jgi:hypothetical protein
MSLTNVCPTCGLTLPGELPHAKLEECLDALKVRLTRITKTFSVAAFKIARCRSKNHGGQPKIHKLDICKDCLGAGYGAYQVAREISISGRTEVVDA